MNTVLILGGTGKTGRRIARLLDNARVASRTSRGHRIDLDDPSTWPAALDGVGAVYVVDPTADRPERIPAFVTAAVDAGVRRLVLLSAPRAGEESHPLHAAEQAVRGSGLDWTILRPDWFAQNFSEGFWLPGILAGTLALPTGEGRTPFIDAEDIAAVAAAALTEEGHHGQIYQLTGSRAISFGEATDLIGKASGRAIHYLDVAPETFTETQVAHGVPRDLALLLANLLVAIRDGDVTPVSDGVTRALGRPPRPFEDYVTEAAADGHWSPDA